MKWLFKIMIHSEDIVLEENIIQVYLYNTFQTDQYKNTYFSSYSINSYVTQASLILKMNIYE